MKGAFLNCGQNCISAERFYVFEGIYQEFIDRLEKRMREIRHGQDSADKDKRCDVGAINLPSQIERYLSLVNDAVEKGAKILSGGKVNKTLNGHFFELTVLTNCNHDMKVMREEAFGPIMSIMKVKSDEQVIELANDCEYGLGSSIFTNNRERARKIARGLETGMTCVNEFGVSATIYSLPFGGIKKSGFGKFGGPEGLRDFTYQKTYVEDKLPFSFAPPAVLDPPTTSYAHERVQDVLKILFQYSNSERLKALAQFVNKVLKKEY